jgi:hypothetical protein
MEKYSIAVFTASPSDKLAFHEPEIFESVVVSQANELLEIAKNETAFQLLLVQQNTLPTINKNFYQQLKEAFVDKGIPIVLVANRLDTKDKIDALVSGCSDVICANESTDEVNTRLLSVIYHQVANKQLKDKFELANQAAFTAMEESSHLGNNIQFLLKSHQSANLDQLGQVFFQVVGQYGLNCSLQMRSKFGVKNMEANGMARKLESELLTQLQHTGRYCDFDQRSIVNYGCVSVLIKNMPEDDQGYGLVKDNTFTLLQGLNARVRALDEHQLLTEEKKVLESLSYSVKDVMANIELSYQSVMLNIVDVVEDMAAKIDDKMPALMLHESQEEFVLNTVNHCVLESNKIFAEGLKVNEHFDGLISQVNEVLSKAAILSDVEPNVSADSMRIDDSSADVELF